MVDFPADMSKFAEVMRSSTMAGVSVGIAGFGYLASRDAGAGFIVMRELMGSVLFSFALLAVVNYKTMLYTYISAQSTKAFQMLVNCSGT